MSVGVNVTPCDAVPTCGAVLGDVNANVPETLAAPPLRVELASVCPNVIADAVGAAVTDGVAFATVTFADSENVL